MSQILSLLLLLLRLLPDMFVNTTVFYSMNTQ